MRFAEGQRPTLDALRDAVAADDGAGAARHAHAIAGAAGNLGAEALREAAKALEHAGRQGDIPVSARPSLSSRSARPRCSARSRTLRSRRAAGFGRICRRGLSTARVAGAALERLGAALDGFDLSSAGGALADLRRVPGCRGWAAD